MLQAFEEMLEEIIQSTLQSGIKNFPQYSKGRLIMILITI